MTSPWVGGAGRAHDRQSAPPALLYQRSSTVPNLYGKLLLNQNLVRAQNSNPSRSIHQRIVGVHWRAHDTNEGEKNPGDGSLLSTTPGKSVAVFSYGGGALATLYRLETYVSSSFVFFSVS
jgi:hypothetical protein